jgi:hypothetical protein
MPSRAEEKHQFSGAIDFVDQSQEKDIDIYEGDRVRSP